MNLTYFHQHFNVITSKYLFFVASAIIAMSPAYFFEKAWSEDLWRHLLNISLAATWVNNGKHVRKRSFSLCTDRPSPQKKIGEERSVIYRW